MTLLWGIVGTVSINFLGSVYAVKKYKPIFEVIDNLEKEVRGEIIKDTRACMYHKIGTTVLNGTDNAVLTKMVNLKATGIYSNYSIILTSLQMILNQLQNSFLASVGNAKVTTDKEEYYSTYLNLFFAGLWLDCIITTCLYAVIDSFIMVWIGKNFVLDKFTSCILCVQFFLTTSRSVNGTFIYASGMFVKDKIRPLIEACINLIISIVLAKYIGIVGVF